MSDQEPIRLVKIDFDALMDECERLDREAHCASCDRYGYVCWCGVCLKYCHNDYFHEDPQEPGP